MSNRFEIVKCPSCGAPLDLKPGHERTFKCEFCGTTLQDQTSKEEEATGIFPKLIIQSQTYSPPPVITYSGGTTTGSGAGRAIGCIVSLIVLGTLIPVMIGVLGAAGITLGSIFAVFNGEQSLEDLFPGGPQSIISTGPNIYSFGAVAMLPSDNDTQSDFVGVASLADDTQRLIYVDFEADSPRRWQSESLGKDASYIYNSFAANNSFVYFSVKSKLYAFSRKDGTTVWQTTMPDEVTNICEDCLRVTGQRVVALTADGMLQAYDAQTGQPVWSVKLNEQPRQLLILGGNPAVKDKRDERISLFVYNTLDGTLLHTIQPQCVNKVFSSPQEPYIYDPIWALPDGQSVVFGFGLYDPYCIQSWNGTTGAMAWETLITEEESGSRLRPAAENTLLTENGLYLSGDSAVWVVNTSDGTHKLLAQHEDYDLKPMGIVQDTLIVNAYRRRGTSRNEIWAIASDGTVRWTFVPTITDMMDNLKSDVANKDGIWTAVSGPDAVYLITAYSDPKRIGFEKINLADGTTSGPKILDIASDFAPGSLWLSILGWEKGHIWVVLTDIAAIYNYQTGELVKRWP